MQDFVNFHTHTTYSIMNSLIKPSELFKTVKELGQSAIAVTDMATLAGAWDCLQYSKEAGIKLIMGCEFYFVDDLADTTNTTRLRHLILLAKNHQGYKNLLLANKLANDNHIVAFKKVIPRIDWKILEQVQEGLICTTACCSGILSQLLSSRQNEKAKEQAQRLKDIFGPNLALELQTNHLKNPTPNAYRDYCDQDSLNRSLFLIAKDLDIKVIPTTDAHFLTPDQSEAHDVLNAIGSGQPIKSKARLKYTEDFCLKSREEVVNFFSRWQNLYGDPEVLCDNTLFFSEMCEEPKWIDPKYSKPTGGLAWELPIFPVQNQPDYDSFKIWKDNSNLTNKPDDAAYLKFLCELGLKEKNLSDNQDYLDRLNKELQVLEIRNLCSYMLIVYDFIKWARDHYIPTGPGRGCLTGTTQVLTAHGFKNLDKIEIGELVYTHLGKLQKVLNTFKYEVNESLLKIKTNHSFNDITLTSDHKVYGCRAKSTDQYKPTWIMAKDLSINDLLYMPFPQISNVDFVYNDFELNEDFLYFLGRWVGNGWFYHHPREGYQTGVTFNSEDQIGIHKISELLTNLGYNVKLTKHKTKKLVQLKVHNLNLQEKLKKIFPDYKSSSNTKHLPIFFRKLSYNQLKILIKGLISSDRSIECGKDYIRENIDTTSYRLALECKEALLYLKIPSSIHTRPEYTLGKYVCKTSYKLKFRGIFTEKSKDNSFQEGYYCKIRDITTGAVQENSVYDLQVENDTSYLTSNYAVHNSVAGSLVAYSIDIHEADPIKYGLIFERFYNLEKIAMSDIDVDIAASGRDQIKEYLRQKYGEDHVAHVSNVNTMTPKVYARDIARVFEFGGDRKTAVVVGTKIADAIPAEYNTIEEALDKASLFREFAESKDYGALKKFSKFLGGKAKAWSTHAGGLIISDRALTEIVPLRKDKDGNIAVEYEKERIEANGLVKMDILGLETLDIIKNTYNLIITSGKTPPSLKLNYDDNDSATYDLISSGDTFCVFQLGESAGTIDLCKKLQPKCMEDLAAITALARPGVPKEFRNQFIEAKFSGKKPTYLHPCLARSLDKTYGIPIFDECMLTLGADVAGWDLNQSDRLRKFIKDKGKHPEKDRKLKEDFIKSTIENGIETTMAAKLWEELFANFNAYLFNKAHAITYSFISYHTAYLKAHYPLEFLTANLMSEVNSNAKSAADNIAKIKDEIRRCQVKILPPDVNKSELTYKIIDNNTLLTGLDSLKFIGKDAIPELIAKRPFTSFKEMLTKVDGKKVRVPSVLALAASGCLDSFNMSRQQMYLYAADYKKKLAVWNKKQKKAPKKTKKGQLSLNLDSECIPTFNYPWPEDQNDWTAPEKYAMETYYLGEGLSGNLKEIYPGFFDNRALNFSKLPIVYTEEYCKNNSDFFNQIPISAENGTIEAIIKNYFEFKVKKEGSKIFGETMAKVVLEDPYGNMIGMTVFPKKLIHFQKRLKELGGKVKLEPGTVIHCSGYINWYEGELSILFDDLKKCASSPPMPSDLKPRKVSMSIAGSSRKKSKEIDPEEFLEEVEDELIEEGLADYEVEEIWVEDDQDEIERPDSFV